MTSHWSLQLLLVFNQKWRLFMSNAMTESSVNLMCPLYQAQTTNGLEDFDGTFHLVSREKHIPDNAGKELASLNDAYAHARVLIDKILLHVGHDVISNDEHDAQMVVPFPVSAAFSPK
jgi:hypothetical protein